MANFLYKAKDLQGIDQQGEVESADIRSAVAILRKKNLVVITVTPKQQSKGNFFTNFFGKVKFSDIVTFTRQLATMIGAGLILSEAVDILYDQQSQGKLKTALEEISRDLKGGLTLAQALSRHTEIFPPLYVNLVKSGEASGKLDIVLLQMADGLEKDREFRAKIKGALIYPAVVVSMMFVVGLIMIIFVIPKLTELFKESSLELPLPTKTLIFISKFATNFWWLVGICGTVATVAGRRWVKTPEGRLAFDKLLLHIPIIGKVVTNVTLTNFCRTFGLLTAAGIPLLDAINIVGDVTQNSVYKLALKASYSGVERGLSFSAQISSLPIFPKLVGQMVRVGEETGKVDEIFYKMADYYEEESDHLVKNLTVAIEPIVLIILGLGVAFLVVSIILPIYQLTTSF